MLDDELDRTLRDAGDVGLRDDQLPAERRVAVRIERELRTTPSLTTRTRPRPRPLRFAPAGLAIAAMLVGLILFWSPGGPTRTDDAFAMASAALQPEGEIVHMVVTTIVDNPGESFNRRFRDESWSATDPNRWRSLRVLPPPGASGAAINASGQLIVDGKRVTGRTEIASAPDGQRSYTAMTDTLQFTEAMPGRPPGPYVGPFGSDRAEGIVAALRNRQARDLGERKMKGRVVRRFETIVKSKTTTERQTLDVDPETFEPVGASSTMTFGSFPPIRTVYRIDLYERLPDDSQHSALLAIETSPRTRIETTTVQEQRDFERRCIRKRPDGTTTIVCDAP